MKTFCVCVWVNNTQADRFFLALLKWSEQPLAWHILTCRESNPHWSKFKIVLSTGVCTLTQQSCMCICLHIRGFSLQAKKTPVWISRKETVVFFRFVMTNTQFCHYSIWWTWKCTHTCTKYKSCVSWTVRRRKSQKWQDQFIQFQSSLI